MLEPEIEDRWRRQADALAWQVADDDPEALAALDRIAKHLQAKVAEAGIRLRYQGYRAGDVDHFTPTYSYGELGRALGVSAQAARQRFSPDIPLDFPVS